MASSTVHVCVCVCVCMFVYVCGCVFVCLCEVEDSISAVVDDDVSTYVVFLLLV